MHQVTSALAENEHELARVDVSLLQLTATFCLVTALQPCTSISSSKVLGIQCSACLRLNLSCS